MWSHFLNLIDLAAFKATNNYFPILPTISETNQFYALRFPLR